MEKQNRLTSRALTRCVSSEANILKASMIMALSGVIRFPEVYILTGALMTNNVGKFQKMAVCIFLSTLTSVLSACGSSGNLFGSAGLSTEKPLSTLAPTEISIPHTYRHIIYLSD